MTRATLAAKDFLLGRLRPRMQRILQLTWLILPRQIGFERLTHYIELNRGCLRNADRVSFRIQT